MNWKSILCFLLVVLVVFITGCSNNIDNSSINKEAETTYQNKIASSEQVKETSVASTTSKINSSTVLEETTTGVNIPDTTQSVYQETEVNSNYNYVGLWEYCFGESDIDGKVRLGIFSIDEENAVIIISKTSANYAHIAGTAELSVPVINDNKLDLSFTDSFGNKCKGYIELNENNVYMKIDIQEVAQPYIFGADVDVNLYKISDEVSKNDFI